MSLPVYCDELGISGKIDVYKQDQHLLIERKNNRHSASVLCV